MAPSEPPAPPSESAKRDVAATLAVLALFGAAITLSLCGTAASQPPNPTHECEAILARFVELRVRAANPKSTPSQIARQQELVRNDSATPLALASCEKNLSEAAAACANAATNADELERCFH